MITDGIFLFLSQLMKIIRSCCCLDQLFCWRDFKLWFQFRLWLQLECRCLKRVILIIQFVINTTTSFVICISESLKVWRGWQAQTSTDAKLPELVAELQTIFTIYVQPPKYSSTNEWHLARRIQRDPLLASTGAWSLAGSLSSSSLGPTCAATSRSVIW